MKSRPNFFPSHSILLLLGASLPFERIPSFEAFGITIRLSLVLGALLIAQLGRQGVPKLKGSHKLAIIFLSALLLATLASPYPGRALMGFIFMAFVIFLAIAVSQTRIEPDQLRRWVVAGAVIAGLFGLFQYFGDAIGLPPAVTGIKEIYRANVFGFPRLHGPALEPLYFANLLLLPLSLTLFARKSRRNWGLLWFFYLLIFLTLSRGGILSAIIVSLSPLLLNADRWRRSLYAATAFVLALGTTILVLRVLLPGVGKIHLKGDVALDRYAGQAVNYEIGQNNINRARTRELALTAFKQRPLTGVGPAAFGLYAHAQDPSLLPTQTANNEPLELLAETGLLGFGAFAVFLISIFVGGVKRLRQLERSPAGQVLAALLVFMVGASVQYLSFSTLYIVHIWVVMGLVMGFIQRGGGAALALAPGKSHG